MSHSQYLEDLVLSCNEESKAVKVLSGSEELFQVFVNVIITMSCLVSKCGIFVSKVGV